MDCYISRSGYALPGGAQMKDLVLIPTYYRAEYLQLCLEHIASARGERDLEVQVWHDRRPGDRDVEESSRVAGQFTEKGLPNGVKFIWQRQHCFTGNIYNFLQAYRAAYEINYRYVYLIEDDVMVSADFFDWHEAVQARRDYFCSVGWHDIRNPKIKQQVKDGKYAQNPLANVESAVDFSSIGVCWKRENLAAIVRHATNLHYNNPVEYLTRTFPNNPLPGNRWIEQAGLIMRELL